MYGGNPARPKSQDRGSAKTLSVAVRGGLLHWAYDSSDLTLGKIAQVSRIRVCGVTFSGVGLYGTAINYIYIYI